MKFNNSISENGIIYIWLVLLVPIIIGILSFLYYNNSRTLIRSQLQKASDSAALAGASALCSQRSCFEDSKNAVVASLKQFYAHGGKSSNSLEVDLVDEVFNDELNSPEIFYPEKNLKVSIERGWWLETDPENNPDVFAFESMEGDWQETYPGIPKYVAANAIRVTTERPVIENIFSIFGKESTGVKTISVATAGPVTEDVPIAPFALPVCALLNDKGDFQTNEVCKGDRIFTASDRYLPNQDEIFSYSMTPKEVGFFYPLPYFMTKQDDYKNMYPNFNLFDIDEITYGLNYGTVEMTNRPPENSLQLGAKPNFFYGPCSDELDECGFNRVLNSTIQTTFENGKYTAFGWGNYAYSNFADHFGVLGSINEAISEDALQMFITQNNYSNIGQKYNLFPGNFSKSTTESIIWNKIINSQVSAKDTIIGSSFLNPGLEKDRGIIAFSTNFYSNQFSLDRFGFISAYLGSTYGGKNHYKFPIKSNFLLKNETNINTPNALESNFYVPNNRLPDVRNKSLSRDSNVQGLCRSKRMGLGCMSKTTNQFQFLEDNDFNPNDCYVNFSDVYNFDTLSETTKDFIVDFYGKSVQLQAKPKISEAQDNVWSSKIPIIADRTKASEGSIYECQGVDDLKFKELQIKKFSNNNFVIIGYVSVDIFDVDIGDIPSNVKAPFEQTYANNYNSSSFVAASNLNSNSLYHYYSPVIGPVAGSEIDCAQPTIGFTTNGSNFNNGEFFCNINSEIMIPKIPTGLSDDNSQFYTPFYGSPYNIDHPHSFTGPNPWYFQVNGKPTACNMVRARVACDTNFIPSTQNSGNRKPILVK